MAAIAEIEIDFAELTVRLMERGLGLKRPPGQTGIEALQEVRNDVTGDPIRERVLEDFEQMAAAAIYYFTECASDLTPITYSS